MQRVVDEEVTLCAEQTAAVRTREHLDKHSTVKIMFSSHQLHLKSAMRTKKLTKTYNFVLQLSLTTMAEPETKGRSTIKKTEDLMVA